MGKIVVLREPRRGDEEWNIYALREAARLKKWFVGVYYSPGLGRLLAVFKPTPGTHINRLVFEEMGESVLRDAYRMVCPSGCGRCCVIHSGAFMIDVEVRTLPPDLQSLVMEQPSKLLRTPGGKIRVYRLDTGSMGRCIFFDVKRGVCILEERGGKLYKPVVCLVTYCTLFAEKEGERYLKTGYGEQGGRVIIHYRKVDERAWRLAVQRMGSVWRRYRRIMEAQEASEATT